MSKIFNLVLIAALVCAIVASVISAAGTIAFIECKDHECRSGCRTISSLPQDTCHTEIFRHDQSIKALCSRAPPSGECYYFGLFAKNGTTPASYCTDANAKLLEYHECDVCREAHHKPGTYMKTTGCNSSTTMTLNYDCDAGCNTCTKVHKVQEKTCSVPTGFPDAVEFTAPTRCAQKIQYFHYNNSDCAGQGQTGQNAFAGVCYSMRGRSHLYHCA